MSLLKKLAGETALYGLSSILGRLLNYVLLPLHIDVFYGFSTAEYGVLTLFFAFAAFLNVIFTYGLETAYFRFASRKDQNSHEIYNLVLSQVLISTLVLGGLGLVLAPWIVDALNFADRTAIFRALILIVSIDTLLAIPFARLRQEHKAVFFVSTKMINIGLNVFLNVFFLIFCRNVYEGYWFESLKPVVVTIYHPDLGIGYVFLANLLANAFVILLLYRSFLIFRFRFDWAKLRPMLVYAYPIMLMGLAGMINQMFDKILLEYLLPENFYPGLTSKDAVGIYGACAKLAIFTTLAIQAFRYAAEPFFFGQAQDKKAPELFARVMRYFVIVCVLLWLGVSLNIDILKMIFIRNPDFYPALGIVPVLLLGNIFLGIYYNLSVWFKLSDQTYFGTWISVGGAVLTVLLNFIFVPLLGYVGSAWVVLIAYFSMSVACYILGQRHYPIPYHLGSAFGHLALGGVLIVISQLFTPESLFIGTLFNFGLLVVYLLYVLWTEKYKMRSKS